MNLEELLDFHLEKGTADVIIMDEEGNIISDSLHGELYVLCQVIDVSYEKVARVVVRRS